MSNRQRRIRIAAAFLLLTSRMKTELENDIDDSPFEQLVNLATALQPQMAKNDEDWTREEEALYNLYDEIGTALDPANGDPGSEVINAWPTIVKAAIGEL